MKDAHWVLFPSKTQAGRLSYCERWLGREGPLGKPVVTQLSAASAALTVVWPSTTLTFPSVGFMFLRISILSYSWAGEGGHSSIKHSVLKGKMYKNINPLRVLKTVG